MHRQECGEYVKGYLPKESGHHVDVCLNCFKSCKDLGFLKPEEICY